MKEKLRLPDEWGQQGHVGARGLQALGHGVWLQEALWLLFRNGKGVAQQERLSQSSTQGPLSPEAGMGRLQTSAA